MIRSPLCVLAVLAACSAPVSPPDTSTLSMTLGGAGAAIDLPLPPYIPVSPEPVVTCWRTGMTMRDAPPDPGAVWLSADCTLWHDGIRWTARVVGSPVDPDAEVLRAWTARAVVVYRVNY